MYTSVTIGWIRCKLHFSAVWTMTCYLSQQVLKVLSTCCNLKWPCISSLKIDNLLHTNNEVRTIQAERLFYTRWNINEKRQCLYKICSMKYLKRRAWASINLSVWTQNKGLCFWAMLWTCLYVKAWTCFKSEPTSEWAFVNVNLLLHLTLSLNLYS